MTLFVLVAMLVPPCAAEFSSSDLEFFESRIRPVLADQCYKCHSAKAKKLKGGLYLDSHAGVLKGGDSGPLLVAGQPDKSRLIEAVRYQNPDLEMPPKSKLSDKVIEDLVEWVKRGAPWPEEKEAHASVARDEFNLDKRRSEQWCFQPLSENEPPATRTTWSGKAIDQFILARLEKEGLAPAPTADKRTLIRRATFDLIGLPPTRAEIEDYLNDASPGAFEKVVDRLLESPHFGEKWARHFMDLIRYAESRGHEFDPNHPNSFEYRDYLIRALNADVPYNDFVKEAVAGDLLSKPRKHPGEGFNESVLGTGFWFLGEWVHSPVDIRGDECDRQANMLDVFSKTFLAQTVACARCHDHKFDAISQKDFYALAGFIQSSAYRQVRFETMEHNQVVAKELHDLRKSHRGELLKGIAQASSPIISKLADYLMASREILTSDVEFASGEQVVFDSFESGTYDGWKIEGKAFGEKPITIETQAHYQGEIRPVGKFFVNTHNQTANGKTAHTDGETGKLISRPFKIGHNYITFMIGGGGHRGKTCMNLVIDGRAVLSQTGFSHNTMRLHRWDVRKFAGKKAHIEIIDNHRGGWGNIGVDHIVFQKAADDKMFLASRQVIKPPRPTEPATVEPVGVDDDVLDELATDDKETKSPKQSPFERILKSTAAKYKIDSARLETFVFALMSAKNDTGNPLRSWAMVADKKEVKPADIARAVSAFPFKGGNTSDTARFEIPNGELIADFTSSGRHPWIQDGVVFGEGPIEAGDLMWGTDASAPLLGIHSTGAAWADPVWTKLEIAPGTQGEPGNIGKFQRAGRTLRTRTFTLKHRNLNYLVRGSGYALVVVDSHRMVQGPLHGRVVRKISEATSKWVSQDLRTDYIGHRVHVEFIPERGEEFAIHMVAQADSNVSVMPSSASVDLPLEAEGIGSADDLAKAYQRYFAAVVASLQKGQATSSAALSWLLSNASLMSDTDLLRDSESLAGFFKKQSELIGKIRYKSRTAPAMWDGTAEDEQLLIRGNHRTAGDSVPRDFLTAFRTSESLQYGSGSGRLMLAGQMTDPKRTPILPRVQVNRIWHHLFGRGLVTTVDDFGNMGLPPTHPELLDFLARRFVELGWSNKQFIKEVLLSSTWQMSSKPGPGDEVDPTNRLYHRMTIRRLTGESIRDAVLAVSGRLDRRLFGQSVPVHLSAQMQGRGRPGSGPVDGAGRRSVYLAVRRNFLSPFLKTFDTPIPFSTMGKRNVSNVPTQALILMNDPFVAEQARLWGKKVADLQDTSTQDRITEMYVTAFARPPSEQETAAAIAFLESQGNLNSGNAIDAAVWSDFGHVLMNVKEFFYLN